MSEWVSVLAVFWALWALDGLRLLPRATFTVIGGVFTRRLMPRRNQNTAVSAPRECDARGPRRKHRSGSKHKADRASQSGESDKICRKARVRYSRLSLPGILPTSWRMNVADVPLVLSPVGVCNFPVGAAGRPADRPVTVRAWRWEEIRYVGVARGMIFVNGEAFCADTGHLKGAELLALARLEPGVRRTKIEVMVRRWFRPANLRRRVLVLQSRTAFPASLNAVTLAGLIALSVYVVGDIASRLPPSWSEWLAETLPWLLLGLLAVHLTAVIVAWTAKRPLRAVANEKRGAALFSALLLPPQALRLRSLLGEGFFPAQHPIAMILAFGNRRSREEFAFNALADLRWPIEAPDNSTPTSEIVAWFRDCLERRLVEYLAQQRLSTERLLTAPLPDSPASCSYCPRCHDQFVDQRRYCPNGIALRALPHRMRPATIGT
jgi:hypothetical protein